MRPVLVLDPGHLGKPDRPNDRGAAYGDRVEASLALQAIQATRIEAARHGIEVITPPHPNTYTARQRWTADLARMMPHRRVIYCAWHYNAGGGGYGLIGHHYRSTMGAGFAATLAAQVRHECPWLSGVQIDRVAPLGVPFPTKKRQRRMWGMMSETYDAPSNMFGSYLELGFVDNDAHWPDGCAEAHARALVRASLIDSGEQATPPPEDRQL